MQTSASVDADIRVGRCRHPRRSVQTSASVGADIRVGRCETNNNEKEVMTLNSHNLFLFS